VKPLQTSATPTPSILPTAGAFTPTETFSFVQPPATNTASPLPTLEAALPGLPVEIMFLKMVDAKNGWARGNLQSSTITGDYILRTQRWRFHLAGCHRQPGLSRWRMAILKLSTGAWMPWMKNTAWAISTTDFLHGRYGLSGTVWRTDDGGRSWKPRQPNHPGAAE